MTKDYVNTLCRSIALTMRKGTGNFAKARKPEQVEATRYTMFLRLLYVVVRFAIPPELAFNMDETGVQLLYFGD